MHNAEAYHERDPCKLVEGVLRLQAINMVTSPKSWSFKKPIDGTITFTAPVKPTVAFSHALGPVSAPLLAFPIDGTVSIKAGVSTLGSVSSEPLCEKSVSTTS